MNRMSTDVLLVFTLFMILNQIDTNICLIGLLLYLGAIAFTQLIIQKRRDELFKELDKLKNEVLEEINKADDKEFNKK